MTVTDITEISKAKVKVSTDEDIDFSLYKSELRTYGISLGGELPKETYDKLVNEVLLKRAKLRCMNLLKGRDYTRHQLEDKLKKGVYPKEVLDKAIEYVKSYGYVDDIRYAVSYIGYKSSSRSTRQIRNELALKGVSKEDIDEAFSQCVGQKSLTDEAVLISRLLEKKGYDSETATYEEKQKIIGFLYRKGFSLDKIYKAVE
jgi:regulatory protein